MAFLNKTGVEHLWSHIVAQLNKKSPIYHKHTKLDITDFEESVITASDDNNGQVTLFGASSTIYEERLDSLETKLNSLETDCATESYVDEKTSECIPAPTSAIEGQVVAVESVDENGKPISWNVVNDNAHNHTADHIASVYDTAIQWGNVGLNGKLSPIEEASSSLHSANRLAFAKPEGITIEYSNDGGVTWVEYSTNNNDKTKLVSGIGQSYYIGQKTSDTTINDQLRITLDATAMGVYTKSNKILLNVNTVGATDCKVKVEKSYKGSESTFSTQGTYSVSGWSGWNSIPFNYGFGGGSTQTTNVAICRLTFTIGGKTNGYNNCFNVLDMVMLGSTYWGAPSEMAKTGHLYAYDANKNATFPSDVAAKTFNGEVIANTYAKIDELNALKTRVAELENILNSNVYLVTNG